METPHFCRKKRALRVDPDTATLLLEDSRSLPSVQGARARLGVIQGMASKKRRKNVGKTMEFLGETMGKTHGFWGGE